MGQPQLEDIILVGGGGNLGPALLDALLQTSGFKVAVLARSSSTSTYPPGVTVHRVHDSYPEDELLEAFRGRDAIICALSSTNILQQIKFADVGVQAGVQWFIPAEWGANKQAAQHGVKLPLHSHKEQVLAHLVDLEGKGLSWTAIATGPFIDWGLDNGVFGFNIKERKAKIYGAGTERWTGTSLAQIGRAVVSLLQKPENFRNQWIYIYSVCTSQNDILGEFEKQTGAKLEVRHVNWDDELAEGERAIKAGDLKGTYPGIISNFFREGMGADYTRDVEPANRPLRLPAEHVSELVAKALSSVK